MSTNKQTTSWQILTYLAHKNVAFYFFCIGVIATTTTKRLVQAQGYCGPGFAALLAAYRRIKWWNNTAQKTNITLKQNLGY